MEEAAAPQAHERRERRRQKCFCAEGLENENTPRVTSTSQQRGGFDTRSLHASRTGAQSSKGACSPMHAADPGCPSILAFPHHDCREKQQRRRQMLSLRAAIQAVTVPFVDADSAVRG